MGRRGRRRYRGLKEQATRCRHQVGQSHTGRMGKVRAGNFPELRKDMIPQKESELHTKEDRSQGLARGPLVPVSGSGLARHRRCQPRCFPQSFREGRASSAAALARSSPTLNTPSRAAPAAHAPSRRRVGGGLFTPDEAESTLAGAQLRLWLVAPGAHAARCSEEAGVHALGRGGHCWQTAIPQLNLWPPSWDF